MNNNKKCYLYETAKIIMLIYLAILNVNYDTVEQYCTLWRCVHPYAKMMVRALMHLYCMH